MPEDSHPPIVVIWPDGQEQTARLLVRQQTPDGWLYQVSVTLWQHSRGEIQPVHFRTWVEAPEHVRPVDGVDYGQVETRMIPPRLPLPDPSRPRGWVLQRVDQRGRGPAQGVIHAPDCQEAPSGAPRLTLDQALDNAQKPGTRLCSLCGAAGELDPMIRGFDHIDDSQ
ncbi:DUF6233 domain-containing protein [Streptomyces sp. NPDC001691]|uniref:DUF6233 domain-containing protein n=1 Tax=Streptomyces sp. NPDC001691 TaxID=3364600 RepID=UPI0036C18EE9